jgi:hypothetical protein
VISLHYYTNLQGNFLLFSHEPEGPAETQWICTSFDTGVLLKPNQIEAIKKELSQYGVVTWDEIQSIIVITFIPQPDREEEFKKQLQEIESAQQSRYAAVVWIHKNIRFPQASPLQSSSSSSSASSSSFSSSSFYPRVKPQQLVPPSSTSFEPETCIHKSIS